MESGIIDAYVAQVSGAKPGMKKTPDRGLRQQLERDAI